MKQKVLYSLKAGHSITIHAKLMFSSICMLEQIYGLLEAQFIPLQVYGVNEGFMEYSLATCKWLGILIM